MLLPLINKTNIEMKEIFNMLFKFKFEGGYHPVATGHKQKDRVHITPSKREKMAKAESKHKINYKKEYSL